MEDDYNIIFSDVQKVLVVTAHPDDFEVVCGATVARLTADKKEVRLVVTTNGNKGVKDKVAISEETLSKQRSEEQQKAALLLGIKPEENFNLGIPDGELEDSLENIEKVVFHIRQFKPDLIITHNPSDEIIFRANATVVGVNHRDHRNTGLITLDAAYPYSRDNNFFPHQLKNGLTRHEVHKILFSDSSLKPYAKHIKLDTFVEMKKEALRMHASQIDSESIDRIISMLMKEDNGYYETFGYVEIR